MEKAINYSIKKIAIVGAESSGKTTLCEDLAKHYNTVFVPEYARTYFETHDINTYSINVLEIIAQKQVELEQTMLAHANTYLFCDTTLITIKIWSQNQFNKVPESITQLMQNSHYDLYLLCNNDIPWIADEQRLHPHIRETIFERNKKELENLNVNYHIIEGIGSEKLNAAVKVVDAIL